MSSSDCSECEDFTCKYKHQDHYDCYVNKIKAVKNIFSKEDIDNMERLLPGLELLSEETDDYEIQSLKNNLKNVIEMYKEI